MAASPWSRRVLLSSVLGPAIGISGYTMYNSSVASGALAASRRDRVEATRNVHWVEQNFTGSWQNIREGRNWTLFSNAFLHQGLLHLGFNSLALYSFGTNLCLTAGPRAFIPIFWGGVLAGNIATLGLEARYGQTGTEQRATRWRREEKVHVGMSGGVFAVTSAMTIIFPRMGVGLLLLPITFPAWAVTGLFAAYSVYATVSEQQSNMDHMGHLGGMAYGAVFGVILRRSLQRSMRMPIW